jgi:hypothetical protein
MLKELNIVASRNTKAAGIFENLFPSFYTLPYSSPSEYVFKYWDAYKKSGNTNNNLNGKIFEYILATLCVREKILPLYLNAKVAFVPNVNYDLMFYSSDKGPICWSVKTSLRERYKQADLEAIALKNVHRRALNYLITLNKTEAEAVQGKITSGDVIGLDGVIVATEKEFDQLIKKLKEFKLIEPPKVKAIESNQTVTSSRVNNYFDI